MGVGKRGKFLSTISGERLGERENDIPFFNEVLLWNLVYINMCIHIVFKVAVMDDQTDHKLVSVIAYKNVLATKFNWEWY